MDPDEYPLSSDVVRVGGSVRRNAKPWSDSVHLLLAHLHTRGFDRCPRPLGVDDRSRVVLEFIEGEPWDAVDPGSLWSESTLVGASRLISAFHAAQVGFAFGDLSAWCPTERDPGPAEVVCHNDFGLHNLVFRNGTPYAIVDFDLAAPGSRLWDLAFCAISSVPLHDPSDRTPAPPQELDIAHRIRLMCDAYGLGDERSRLPAVVAQRAESIANGIRANNRQDMAGALRVIDRTRAYIEASKHSIQAALTPLSESS
jgi:hypothetical protein